MSEMSLNPDTDSTKSYSINKIALKNFRSDIIMKMLAITGKTFAEYKANPVFNKDETISGKEIIDTYTYRIAPQGFKNEIELLAMSTLNKAQPIASKSLGLALKGASNFYKNDIESEQKAA